MLQENQLFANRYRLVKRLGQGAFSEVWKAEDTMVGNLTVALKVYAPDKGLDEDGAKIFGEEFAIVFNIHHQNLLTPSTFDKEQNSPYLVLPFCERGSATRLIGIMDERQVAQFLRDVSSALAYLHSKEIVHQDIKPDNVLIDGEGSFLVTDFGISTRIRSTLRRSVGGKSSAGTMAYMGPERFSTSPKPIKASDIWSLGATVYELMTGDAPFGDMGGGMQQAGAFVPDVPGSYSEPLKRLVQQCLAKEPWDRPTAEQIRDICDTRLRQGYWDLSPLQQKATGNGAQNTSASGRPTTRRVDIPIREPEVESPKQEPKKREVRVEKDDAERRKIGKTAGIVVGVLLGLVALFFIVKAFNENKEWSKIQYVGTEQEYWEYIRKWAAGENSGKHVREACENISNILNDRAKGYISQSNSLIQDLKNTWSDFEPVVESMNSLYDQLNQVEKDLNNCDCSFDLRAYLQLDELIDDIHSAKDEMRKEVQSKIDALQQNIKLGSTSVIQYVDELKRYKGLGDDPNEGLEWLSR